MGGNGVTAAMSGLSSKYSGVLLKTFFAYAAGSAAAPMERARRFLAAVRGLKREREGILNAKRFVRTQIQDLR